MCIIGCVANVSVPRKCDECGGDILHMYSVRADGGSVCIWCGDDGPHSNSRTYIENGAGMFLIHGEHVLAVMRCVAELRSAGTCPDDGYGRMARAISGF